MSSDDNIFTQLLRKYGVLPSAPADTTANVERLLPDDAPTKAPESAATANATRHQQAIAALIADLQTWDADKNGHLDTKELIESQGLREEAEHYLVDLREQMATLPCAASIFPNIKLMNQSVFINRLLENYTLPPEFAGETLREEEILGALHSTLQDIGNVTLSEALEGSQLYRVSDTAESHLKLATPKRAGCSLAV